MREKAQGQMLKGVNEPGVKNFSKYLKLKSVNSEFWILALGLRM